MARDPAPDRLPPIPRPKACQRAFRRRTATQFATHRGPQLEPTAGAAPLVRFDGAFGGGACAEPVQHLPRSPTGQVQKVGVVNVRLLHLVGERVPELVRMDARDFGFLAALLDDLIESAGADAASLADPEKGFVSLRVLGPREQVEVDRLSRAFAERHAPMATPYRRKP